MKLSLKNMISFWLSFLFLLTTVHSHPHHGGNHSEPTVLNESDEIEHTDSITHECEKCLVKNYKSKIKTDIKICNEASKSTHQQPDESFKKYEIPYSLNSRPPPVSHL